MILKLACYTGIREGLALETSALPNTPNTVQQKQPILPSAWRVRRWCSSDEVQVLGELDGRGDAPSLLFWESRS